MPRLRNRAETAIIVKTSWDLKSMWYVESKETVCKCPAQVLRGELEQDSFVMIPSIVWN